MSCSSAAQQCVGADGTEGISGSLSLSAAAQLHRWTAKAGCVKEPKACWLTAKFCQRNFAIQCQRYICYVRH